MELVDADHVLERGSAGPANLLRLLQDEAHLGARGDGEMGQARARLSRGGGAVLIHGHQRREQQQIPGANGRRAVGHRRGHGTIDDLLARRAAIGERHHVDLDDPLDHREARRRDDAERAAPFTEMSIPDLDEVGKVLDVAEVGLSLDDALERGAGGFQRRLDALVDDELGLQANLEAGPQRAVGHMRARIDRPIFGIGHLTGDEDVVA